MTIFSPFRDLRIEASRRRRDIGGRPLQVVQDAIELSLPDWIEKHFFIPETNKPMQLYPLQREAILASMATDETGRYLYSTVIWSDIKKSAKTCIAAARAIYQALRQDWAMVRVVGNDLKQAQSRTFHYIERCMKMHPELKRLKRKSNRFDYPNNSYIEAVPIDPDGEAGGGDDVTVYTEMWAWKSKAHQRMWTETTLSPLKAGYSQRWVESYAGFTGESPILERLYQATVEEGQRISTRPFFTDGSGTMFCMWNQTPHLPWQTDEYYAQQEAELVPNEFSRVHRNLWSSSRDEFVPDGWFEACQVDELPDPYRLVIALDAGVKNDSFGLSLVGTADKETIDLYDEREYVPPKGGEVQLADVERDIYLLIEKYPVAAIAYDPYQLKDMAQRMAVDDRIKSKKIKIIEFNQGARRATADKALRDKIREKNIRYIDAPKTTAHVNQASVKIYGDQGKLRIIKPEDDQSKKVDLAVALSMAADVAIEIYKKPPPKTTPGSITQKSKWR